MNYEYFAEMHKLIEKAKTYERLGREEEALKIYLEIHERFFPNTSDLFERPAILLEKRRHFQEAIEMCEKAIKLINEGKITGIKENFERRIQRIKSRSDYTGPKDEQKKDKKKKEKQPAQEKQPKTPKAPKPPKTPREPFHWPKLKWHQNDTEKTVETKVDDERPRRAPIRTEPVRKEVEPIVTITKEEPIREKPETKSEDKRHVEVVEQRHLNESEPIKHEEAKAQSEIPVKAAKPKKESFVRLKAYIKGFRTEHKRFRKPTKNEWIALAILVAFIGGGSYMITHKPKSQFEIMIDMTEMKRGPALEGSPFETKPEDLPPITKTMIDAATKEVQAMPGVKQAGIIVQKDVVGFVVITNPGTSKAQAKNACEVFVKGLARAAATENTDLKGPGLIGYGELFDYYTLLVVAGEGNENLILKGSKNPKVLGIYWRNE